MRLAVYALLCAAAVPAVCAAKRDEHLVQNLPFADHRDKNKVGDSYAGHVVVRKTAAYEAGLFYWYFKAEENADTAPLVVYVCNASCIRTWLNLLCQLDPGWTGQLLRPGWPLL